MADIEGARDIQIESDGRLMIDEPELPRCRRVEVLNVEPTGLVEARHNGPVLRSVIMAGRKPVLPRQDDWPDHPLGWAGVQLDAATLKRGKALRLV